MRKKRRLAELGLGWKHCQIFVDLSHMLLFREFLHQFLSDLVSEGVGNDNNHLKPGVVYCIEEIILLWKVDAAEVFALLLDAA